MRLILTDKFDYLRYDRFTPMHSIGFVLFLYSYMSRNQLIVKSSIAIYPFNIFYCAESSVDDIVDYADQILGFNRFF